MSLPGEILRTEFRLVVTHDGWEYTVLERELGAHRDPLRKMLVTVRCCLFPAVPVFPALLEPPHSHWQALGIGIMQGRAVIYLCGIFGERVKL